MIPLRTGGGGMKGSEENGRSRGEGGGGVEGEVSGWVGESERV
jgi:hypothetical protein